MKKLLLVFGLVVFSFNVSATEDVKPLFSVNGKIVKVNHEPIKTYLIDAVSGEVITYRKDNYFDLSDLPKGKYIIKCKGINKSVVIEIK